MEDAKYCPGQVYQAAFKQPAHARHIPEVGVGQLLDGRGLP